MSQLIDRAQALLARHLDRVRNRQFLDAAMAASALVASADGQVTLAELLSRDEVLLRVEALQAFDSNDAVDRFRDFVGAIEADRQAGTERALHCLAPFGRDAAAAQLLLRAAVAIAKADAEFSAEEQRAIFRICETLGVEQVDLGEEA